MAQSIQYSVTLQGWMSPVFFQGSQGTCGPCTAVNALGMISNMYGDHFSVNPQILYNMSLITEKALGQDIGVNPTKFMNLLKNTGVTENTDLDYGMDYINVTPSQADYTDAKNHTITGFTKIDLATQENTLSHVIAGYLQQGKAMFFSFNATYNFMSQMGPLSYQLGDNTGTVAGGHMVQVTGVDTATNMLTVASWGTPYGDNGLFHMSLDSFYNKKGGDQFNLQSIFVVNGFDGKDLTQNIYTKTVAEAYVGIFDRAPELEGMKWYSNDIKNGRSLASLCDDLLSSQEYLSTHVGQTNSQFLETIYHNVLNRDVDAEGLQYWNTQILNGQSKGSVAASIITEVVQEGKWAYDTWVGTSHDSNMFNQSLLFNNKLTAAQDYAITLQADSQHTQVAHQIIDKVTVDPGSIWSVALVGVNDALGRPHIDGIMTS